MRPLQPAFDLLETAAFVASMLPALVLPYRAAVGFYGMVGRILLPLTPITRRISDNLAIVDMPLDARRLAAQVGDNFMRTMIEYARMRSFANRSQLRRAHGVERLQAAVAHGRGVVLVSAHYGNWEAIRLAAREAGVEVGLIYRSFNNAFFDRLARGSTVMAGEPVMHKGKAGQREMLRLLRGGGAILILLDQRLGDGVDLDFLGRPARTTTAVAALAQRMGAPLMPAVARRREDGLSFDVTFEDPVAAKDPQAAMAAINARFGAWIADAPGQWFWLHRRWKGVRRG
jgi:KDO2-lipid IV(A) lauroyltransferase